MNNTTPEDRIINFLREQLNTYPKIDINGIISILKKELPKAIIFWDTCGFLDIFNLLIPDYKASSIYKAEVDNSKGLSQYFRNLQKVKAAVSNNQKPVISMASAISLYELRGNGSDYNKTKIHTTRDTLRNAFDNHLNAIDFFSKAHNHFNNSPANNVTQNATYPSSIELISKITEEVATLLFNTTFLPYQQFTPLGVERVLNQKAPAHKRSWTDSTIWETFLYVAQQVGCRCFFISNNTKDFGESGEKVEKLLNEAEKEQWGSRIFFCHSFKDLGQYFE